MYIGRSAQSRGWRSLRASRIRNGAIAVLVAMVFVARPVFAGQPLHPLEPPDTSSPRAVLNSLIDSTNAAYRMIVESGGVRIRKRERVIVAQRILRCLDLSELPEFARISMGKEAAVCLKEVLDRIELPPDDEIPHLDEQGEPSPAEALPDRWTIPYTEITIAKVKEGPRVGEYLFSPHTVGEATAFYERVKHLTYKPGASEGFYDWYLTEPGSVYLAALVNRLPGWAHQRVYGQTVWQWIGLATAVALGLLVMFFAYRLGRRSARSTRRSSVFRYCVTLALPTAAMFIPLLVKDFVSEQLVVSGTTLNIVSLAANLVFLVAVMVVLVGAGSRIAEVIIASPRIHPQGIDAQFIRMVCRVLSLGAAVIVFLEGGKYLGIPLTTLLAGAGVGGLALALAAQDTLKNLFGSMMILLDKPYRVGERIVVNDYDGVVEDIGLRSTKIRLLTGHQVAIPNEQMARSDVENIARRPYIRRIVDITIPSDVPSDKVERALVITRRLLENHEGMDPEFPPRVYFNDYNRDSLNLRIMYWYHPPSYWDFLAFTERINLQIKRNFEAAGIPFAMPLPAAFLTRSVATPSVPSPVIPASPSSLIPPTGSAARPA